MQGPAGGLCSDCGVHPGLPGAIDGRLDQTRTIAWRRAEGEGAESLGLKRLVRQRQASAMRIQRLGCPKPPVRHARDQDDASGTDDEGRFARRPPFGLQGVELDLDDHNAQGAGVRSVHTARKIKTGATRNCAQGEKLSLAIAHGVDEIGPEAVVRTDEAGGQTPVAGGSRSAVDPDDVDGGCACLARQTFQFLADEIARSIRPGGQQVGDVGISGQGDRQGAVFFQLAAQDGGMERGRGIGLAGQFCSGVAAGGLACAECDDGGDQHPPGSERQPSSSGLVCAGIDGSGCRHPATVRIIALTR